MAEIKKYKTNFLVIIDEDIISGEQSKFSSIAFINTAPIVGGADVLINGATLVPGASLSINDETRAIDNTMYNIQFVVGGINRLLVITKTYI
jgi:hypothetical protein